MYYTVSKNKEMEEASEDEMMKEQEETLKIEEMEDLRERENL